MLEKLKEFWEQFMDKARSQRWLQLLQEFESFNQFGMVVTVSFPDEDLNLLVKRFAQTFICPGIIQFDEPNIKSFKKHLLHIQILI